MFKFFIRYLAVSTFINFLEKILGLGEGYSRIYDNNHFIEFFHAQISTFIFIKIIKNFVYIQIIYLYNFLHFSEYFFGFLI